MRFLSELIDLEHKKIVLASQSPRRQDMLKAVGLDFEIVPAQIPENPAEYDGPIDYAQKSARIKANWVWEGSDADLLIAADTIVVKDNRIFEKPKDKADAIRILSILSNAAHTVVTAFCLRSKFDEVVGYETTSVYFHPISQAEMEAYIASGEPFDKAGGYGVQGYGGVFIKKIDGCFYNVVGFPLPKVYQALRNMKL